MLKIITLCRDTVLCFTFFMFIYPASLLYTQPTLPNSFADLSKQDRALIRDLILLNYPPLDWRKWQNQFSPEKYDVVIVGAGMAGLTAGAALFKEGIYHIKLFDQNEPGCEGPWVTYARMKTLRSTKDIMGPALGIPHLTFHAWFEALYGAEAWKNLYKIPNQLWMDYLVWFRQVLQLPVENSCILVAITPTQDNEFELEFRKEDQNFKVQARKVILATGRTGFGGPEIPEFMAYLPKSLYAHTIEPIDFNALKGKRVGIIGTGASGFDAAAAAVEANVHQVDLIMRRKRLPNVNKLASLPYKGFSHGYYHLSDEKRLEFMSEAFKAGAPPPFEALCRLENAPNVRILTNRSIIRVNNIGAEIQVETSQGTYVYDFLILGTGFTIDGSHQPELRNMIDQIALWKDCMPKHLVKQYQKLGDFPYLGPSFEFLPKIPGETPYLKNLYCYNYGATLSHGFLSSDIPAVSIGATRLAQGITADFFSQDSDWYLECLKKYEIPELEQEDFELNFE